MTRLLPFIDGEYYHIYNRAINKMPIFNEKIDYDRFHNLLEIVNNKEKVKPSDSIKSPNRVWRENANKQLLVNIGAYCIMPNHFHILIKSINSENSSKFLQRLQLAYSKYFNIKNERSGVLFEGKVKTKHITNDHYLKYIFSYIHLNPIKLIQKDWKEVGIKNIDKAKEYLKNYKYSSYLDFIEERPESIILNKSVFPEYFNNPEVFKNEVFEWLKYEK